jgi:hypothetical protein
MTTTLGGLAIAGAMVFAVAGAAHADELTLVPSPAVRCLTPAQPQRGEPEYPSQKLAAKKGGRVAVELIFTTPDKRPEVRILESEGGPDFIYAVEDHVRAFRVPCLEYADIPVRLRQEYSFVRDHRKVLWSAPSDAADPERARLVKCVKHLEPKTVPDYPIQDRRDHVQGRVLLQLRFTSPHEAPQVRRLDSPWNRSLALSAEEWAAGYRMPCHQGQPINVLRAFEFKFEGAELPTFKDLSLRQFVGAIKDIETMTVHHDFTAMGCPFDVRLHYLQPHLPNAVGELETSNPARRPLLDWLASVTLKLPDKLQSALLGDKLTLTIPCGTIHLNPQPV